MINKETIERFFLQQSSTDEVAEVLAYFEKHPESLSNYLAEEETAALNMSVTYLPAQKTAELWKYIKNETIQERAIVIYLKRAAVAASVILVIALSWILLFNKKGPDDNIALNKVRVHQKTTTNNTDKKMAFYLSDATYIELMPKSSLSYADTFINGKRDVVLQGEAFFHVSKNANMPFTVYSDVLATTVLGTQFTVKAFTNEPRIQVSLFEGKVVIASAKNTVKSLDKDVYLKPGDTFYYDKKTGTYTFASLQNIQKQVAPNEEKATARDNKGIPEGNWYMFNNQELSEVFKQLEVLYSQKISFSKADVKGMTFIGKLDKSDSLDNILQSIALLNNLKVTRDNGTFIISKK